MEPKRLPLVAWESPIRKNPSAPKELAPRGCFYHLNVCIEKKGIPMKSFTQKVQKFLVSEDGPTAVEYAVMLALIVIVCLTAISSVGTNTKATFQKVADSIGT